MKVLLRHKPLVSGAVIMPRNSTAASRTLRKAPPLASSQYNSGSHTEPRVT